jgi:hypothetical protein
MGRRVTRRPRVQEGRLRRSSSVLRGKACAAPKRPHVMDQVPNVLVGLDPAKRGHPAQPNAVFYNPVQCKAIKGLRWLLLHRRDNLEKDAARRLERSLEINQPLKEELSELWQQDDGRRAWAFLREWAAKATASGIRQLQAMAKTLLRQPKGILSFYHTGLTSGKIKGINRKIRGLLASAFGFRDDDFLKLPGVIAGVQFAVRRSAPLRSS